MARPQVVLSAYTGYLLCDFADLHAYAQEVLARTIFDHEMGSETFERELRDAVKARGDFARTCAALEAAFPPPATAGHLVAPSKESRS